MSGNKINLTGLMLICLAASITTFANELGELTNKEPATLDFVTFHYPPYVVDPVTAEHTGLAQLILQQLMDKAGLNYTLQFMPPKRAELFAQFTPNTCVFPIEKSQEREVFFSWVSPLLISHHGLYRLASQKPIILSTLEDARSYRIGSYLGSSIGEYLNSFDYLVDLATRNDANIHKLKANRIDLWASDKIIAKAISKEEGIELSDSQLDFFTTLRAIGCHHDVSKKIIQLMNKTLQQMYKSGQMKALQQTNTLP